MRYATSDATVRRLAMPGGEVVLLSDTVGFVRKLPHQLVQSFRSTLEEVVDADLLLHVVDAASPEIDRRILAVQEVLREIGAGEIEGALLEHRGVSEAAVTGEPDDDLGERIVAWVVTADGESPSSDDLADHVASLLTPHKRPRVVHFVDELPRNAMGKVQKARLGA